MKNAYLKARCTKQERTSLQAAARMMGLGESEALRTAAANYIAVSIEKTVKKIEALTRRLRVLENASTNRKDFFGPIPDPGNRG